MLSQLHTMNQNSQQQQQHQQQQHYFASSTSSISPSEFNGLELSSPIVPGPRSYKSRKYRPCDFCRARQVACKIDSSPPCQLCSNTSRQCTFVERPKKKRRPTSSIGNHNGEGSSVVTSGLQQQQYDTGGTQLSPSFIAQYNHDQTFSNLAGHNGFDANGQLQNHLSQAQDASPTHIYKMDPYLHMLPVGVRTRPLDSMTTRYARIIGETGESNPYLLRHYNYDNDDECTISKLTYRRIKSTTSQSAAPGEKGEPPVVFMLADDVLAQKGEPRVEDEVLSKARSDVSNMFTEQEGLRLIGLFFRFVYPYFPILSKSEFYTNGVLSPSLLHTLPLSLLSAIYATALPFMLYDDFLATSLVHSSPPAHQLFRISWMAATQEQHTPRLATLQACLLLLQRAPTNRYTTDTPWKTSLVGWTVSLAQVLGLGVECGNWTSIPALELMLRKRLWYGVFIMDKWASLGAGMPSHIKEDDWDVLPLSEGDNEPPLIDQNSSSIPGFLETEEDSHHFRLLSELTLILSDIMDNYYSLRATRRTSQNLALSLDLARPLRERLKNWTESLPPSLALHQEHIDARGMARLSGNPSLSLAYIVTTITLFRALLRPVENLTGTEEENHSLMGSRHAIRSGATECAKEVVEFAENLGRGALDAFWHSWSRANFAIASSFLIQLYLISETEAESTEIKNLVDRWRWAMRVGGSAGSGLMSLGLLRMDGLLFENGPMPNS